MRIINFKEIIVPNYMLESKPSEHKVNKKRENLLNGGKLKRMTVTRDNQLVDGYITWILLNEQGYSGDVEVYNKTKSLNESKKSDKVTYKNSPTVYVFGRHYNNDIDFVWRLKNDMECTITVGDNIMVPTKYGFKPIIVTKIETLDNSPVNMRVKPIRKIVEV